MKKILLPILVVGLSLLSMTILASNTPATVYSEDKTNVMVTPDHPTFVIKLKSNATTGYSWFLREYDSAIITPVKHSFTQPTTALIGASGSETWTFKVKAAGFAVPQQTTIRMIYARPWQGSDSSTQLVFRVSTTGASSRAD